MQAAFFDAVRSSLFGGKLTQSQVVGIEALERAWKARGDGNLQRFAYVLATAFHETARTMQPIYERGPRDYFDKYEPSTKIGKVLGNRHAGDGYLYRGRGHVQLTGRANYLKAGKALSLDLINHPDRALDLAVSAHVCVVGCLEGWFSGKDLADYIDGIDEDDAEDLREFTNARRVVNGTDKAALIGGYALQFEKALKAAKYGNEAPKPQPSTPSPSPTTPKRKTLMDWFRGWFVQQATTRITKQIKETNMFSFLDGYKTYIAAALGILLAIAQLVGVTPPIVPPGEEIQFIWQAVLVTFLRQGVKKIG